MAEQPKMSFPTRTSPTWARGDQGADEERQAPAGPVRGAHIAGLLIGVMFMGSTLLTPLYVLYQRAFGFSEVMLTLIYAVYVVGNVGALFFFGRLSDQLGRRRTSLPAIALAGVASLIFLFARDTAWLFIARTLSGLAIGVAAGTATAWVAELVPDGDKEHASTLAVTANMIGIAVGPVFSGLLAEYAPAPLRLSWLVYLVLLALAAWPVARLKETVERPVGHFREISFRARIGVPPGIRAAFVAPAAAAFASFALGGYYAALMPSLLAGDLGLKSPAVGGAVVGEFFAAAAATVVTTRRLSSRTALLAGMVLLVPSLGCLLLAQSFASLTLLLIGTSIGGAASALSYRGTLQVVNGIAPPDQRAEVISSYMIVCFVGNSVPVIGVGVLSALAGRTAANEVFAATIALLAALGFATGWRYAPRAD